MTDPQVGLLPAARREQALSRAALERVLARAAQLQAATGEGDEPGSMTEAQLVELGKEVGLSGDLLRQALAEERGRTLLPVESGWLASVTGVAAVTAARTVTGRPAAVLAALDAWMQREEAHAGEATVRGSARVGSAARHSSRSSGERFRSGDAASNSCRRTR